MSSFDVHSNRYDKIMFIWASALVLIIVILAVLLYNKDQSKLDALLIGQAMEKEVDLNQVRCVLHPHIPGCDTTSLVRELRLDPRFAPRSLPSVGADIQP